MVSNVHTNLIKDLFYDFQVFPIIKIENKGQQNQCTNFAILLNLVEPNNLKIFEKGMLGFHDQ